MNRLFAALMAILLLALPIAAFAEGETPPAETQAPVTTPNPTPEPTPQPTPVADKLIIDSWNLYDGMDRTYQQGYVPRIVNGCCYIIFPLIGETYDGKVTVTADLGATADSPFVFGNYSQTAAGWGRYVFMFEIPLVKGRINGSYPVTLKADYLDVLGQQKQQSFTVFVTVSDGKKPRDPDAKEAAEKPELFISACEITPDTVGGDGEFSVNVKIDNIGSIRARSVRLTYGSEADGILPYDTNNAILLDNIASGEGAEAAFKMRTTKDVIAGSRAFFITLDYVDLYGGVQRWQEPAQERHREPDRRRAFPNLQRVLRGYSAGAGGLRGNEGVRGHALHDGGLHRKLRQDHGRIHHILQGRRGGGIRGERGLRHRDTKARDRGRKDRRREKGRGGAEARHEPVVGQRAGGICHYRHSRGDHSGEQGASRRQNEIIYNTSRAERIHHEHME